MHKKLLISIYRKYNGLTISAKAALWFVFCSVLQKCISFITVPLFTRMMTTAQYGQYSLYTSWLQIFQIITTFQLTGGVFNKGISKYDNDKNGYTSSMQGLTSTITIVCFIIYLLFQDVINEITELSTFVTIMIFVQLLVAPAMQFWMIRQRYDFKYISVIVASILFAILNPIIGLIAVNLSNEKGLARIFSCIAVEVLFGLYFYFLNLKKGKKLFDIKYWRFAFFFNLPLIPHYVSTYILGQADRIMIQKFCGYSAAGIYSVAHNAALVMSIVTSSINQSLIPWMYRELKQGNIHKVEKQINNIAILISGIVVSFICFAPELIYILGGKEYASAVYAMPPISISLLYTFLYTLYGNIEFYYDKNKFTMYVSVVGAVLNIILNYVFIPIFGYVAAGYTTMVCYFIFCYGHYYFARHIIKCNNKESFESKTIISIGCSLAVVGSLFSLLYPYTILRYAILIVALVTIFLKRNNIMRIINNMRKE